VARTDVDSDVKKVLLRKSLLSITIFRSHNQTLCFRVDKNWGEDWQYW
jgi:hypothetical protein